MTPIRSKRSFLTFYVPVLSGSFAFLVMGAAMLEIFFQESAKNPQGHYFIFPVMAVAICTLGAYTVWSYFRNAPHIRLEKKMISFNNQDFPFSELKNMALTGKRPFKFIMNFPMEGALLEFEDGTKKYIIDNMYSNSSQLKLFLDEEVLNNRAKTRESLQHPISADLSELETFKGNPFISLRGFTLSFGVATSVFLLIKFPSPGLQIFFVAFGIAWVILSSRLMNYFMLSPDLLVVKNHILFWQMRVYRTSSIKEIVFEAQGKMPNSLRVITADYKTRLYPAGTLKDKSWLELKLKLEEKHIKVRNECI
jgi:hypothetical protein